MFGQMLAGSNLQGNTGTAKIAAVEGGGGTQNAITYKKKH